MRLSPSRIRTCGFSLIRRRQAAPYRRHLWEWQRARSFGSASDFLTYKQHPDSDAPACEIAHVYGRAEALEVVSRSLADYRERFGDLGSILTGALEIAR